MVVSMRVVLAAALIPCLILMQYTYKKDTIEKEPTGILLKLFFMGCLSTIPAVILETIGVNLLVGAGLNQNSLLFIFLENFLVVGLAEEFCKRFMLRLGSWNHPAFDYIFDGVVYGVFVSLGFAALENIGYVMSFGLQVAPIRGIAAIPLHAICGLFMGHIYGMAKHFQIHGEPARSRFCMSMSLLIPVLIHGFYDFCASIQSDFMGYVWLIFVVIIDIISIKAVKKASELDMPV